MMRKSLMIIVLLVVTQVSRADLVIGAYDSTRAGSFSPFSLGIPAFVSSHIPDVTFVGATELTTAFLSSIDVLLLTSNETFTTSISPLTTSERAALDAFIQAGGGVVAATSDDSSFTAPFDTVIGRDYGTGGSSSTVPNPSISPVTDGPFGIVSSYTTNAFGGVNNIFSDLGDYATPIGFNLDGDPTLAVIPEDAFDPGSGRVVLFADPETALESFLLGGALVLNAIEYVAVPEVNAFSMGIVAVVLLIGVIGSPNRRRLSATNRHFRR